MKIIHTSDWHLGHNLYGYDRTEEQKGALDQIEDLVREEKPDALVVSGDIFHTPQPSSAVQTLFTEAVMRMHAASPGTAIIITAGNHDSAARHEISRILWETQNVHMIGSVDKEDTAAQVIGIPGKGYVVAVPYINERSIPEGFWQGLLDDVEARNESGLPVVLSAHLTVSGSDFRGHDDAREYSVGGIDSVELDEMGTGYDYAALGHIHHAQTLKGSDGKARYSGTPVPVSFDEAYPHSVSVVEIAAHGDTPQIREVEILNPRPLVTLPADGFASWDEVKELVEAFPKDIPAYLRLNVEIEDTLPPEAVAQVKQTLADGQARFCLVNSRRSRTESAERRTLSVSEFRAKEPIEVARLFAEDSGFTLSEDLEELFREAEQAVKEKERNE